MQTTPGDTVRVNAPKGIRWLTRRRDSYAHLGDLLESLDALEAAGREAGHDTYLLEKFREAVTSSYARAR